jgi:uncharacterized protein YfdQ (DUF2303 family)
MESHDIMATREAAFALCAYERFDPSKGSNFAVVPDDFRLESLERFQDCPNRIQAHPKFRTVESLCGYVNRFSTQETVAFSSPGAFEVTVNIDYHNALPAHCDHTAGFKAIFDHRYSKWREIDGRWLSQKDAGIFLEERASDLQKPDPATMMDVIMSFEALKRVEFKQSTRLHDGSRQFLYQEENEARGSLQLPEQVVLRTPVFEGEESDDIVVRIRFDIQDGKLRFKFDISEREILEKLAFQHCEKSILDGFYTKIPLFQTY